MAGSSAAGKSAQMNGSTGPWLDGHPPFVP